MFVGYAKDHEGDCYQMWNPKTSGVHATRDVIWLRRMFYTAPVEEPKIAMDPGDYVIIVDTATRRSPTIQTNRQGGV
jgi:hypothetical protein